MKKNQNEQDPILISFKKSRSLIDTIIRMAEEKRYCVDIMQQNLAAIGLLKSAHEKLMSRHLKTCFLSGVTSGNKAKQNRMISEIETVMKMGNR